jgi:hypothetical protein
MFIENNTNQLLSGKLKHLGIINLACKISMTNHKRNNSTQYQKYKQLKTASIHMHV